GRNCLSLFAACALPWQSAARRQSNLWQLERSFLGASDRAAAIGRLRRCAVSPQTLWHPRDRICIPVETALPHTRHTWSREPAIQLTLPRLRPAPMDLLAWEKPTHLQNDRRRAWTADYARDKSARC